MWHRAFRDSSSVTAGRGAVVGSRSSSRSHWGGGRPMQTGVTHHASCTTSVSVLPSGARVTLHPATGHTAMPWRNGGGVTHEIAVDPAVSSALSEAPFRWRLSMAELEGSGPFSEIPGVDRIIVVLEGLGIELGVNGGAPVPLQRHVPFSFPADVPTSITMAPGGGRDLNLMWDRTTTSAAVTVLAAGGISSIVSPLAIAIALDGPVSINLDGETFRINDLDALRLDGVQTLTAVDGPVYLALIT
jgi:environmental stress-induced protein Ves